MILTNPRQSALPELPFVGELTPTQASEEFERRVQILLEAGLPCPGGAGEDARRNLAAGLLQTLYPALVSRLAVLAR
jgi:hypothetical protein